MKLNAQMREEEKLIEKCEIASVESTREQGNERRVLIG